MRFVPAIAAIVLVSCPLTGCTGEPADTPAAGRYALMPTALVDDNTTCDALYGASTDGPIVDAVDIVRRFETKPDLSLVTVGELQSTIIALDDVRTRASVSSERLIDRNEVTLRQLLTIQTSRVNATVDTGVFKQAGMDLLGFCAQYLQ
ncbi:hypothetical protein KPL76_05920 [Subtercola sp. PAMC28395]|uniref:hypothetical protein n=1 Tax=Subtercola sp. PAMC28395 TaxID=2846775 RepID=UPI001C0CE051|nr:hypothetical protein [Subtercola sp. PAMC28395]QWT24895.1 hypothetical protein KPL76_05920 [Subtercola sp. PAMC28395]